MSRKVNECKPLKLGEAITEGEDINIQEKLFGWAMTKFVQIAQMTNALEPYKKLWTITAHFFKNYTSWMNGPFSHLDPEVGQCSLTLSNTRLKRLDPGA